MPRCEQCHSQWATFLQCPHCERKFPCPKQFSLITVAVFAVLVAAVYVLSSFTDKVEDWRAVGQREPVVENPVTVEIDKSGVQ